MVSSKVGWRHAAHNVAKISAYSGTMESPKGTALNGGGTPNEGLTAAPELEVAAVANDTKETALNGLARAQLAYEEARLRQAQAILLARDDGLSNRAIGDILGITEGAVRYIVKKLGGGDGAS